MLGLRLISTRMSKFAGPLLLGTLGAGCLASMVLLTGGVHAFEPPGPSSLSAAPVPIGDEALSGFNNKTNGFEPQAAFDADRASFERVELIIPDGLGPVYNGTSCVGCHQDPITGSSTQNAELRVGHNEVDPSDPMKMIFVEPPSGSLIHQRATDAAAQEHVPDGYEVRALRMSSSVLGDGFVEVIPDSDIIAIQNAQPPGLKGLPIVVPVPIGLKKGGGPLDFDFVERLGRFGWKCQEASITSFAAGAYLNEMGVTNPLQPNENTSNGRNVLQFDFVGDVEDAPVDTDPEATRPFGEDINAFTRFIRSTKVPPRVFWASPLEDVIEGEKLFRDNAMLGCAICHQPDYTTPPPGTLTKPYYDGGSGKAGSDMVTVPDALGSKIIHPFSDFMLHDIGTGDGIAQTQHAQKPPQGIANLEKTPGDILKKNGIVRVKASSFSAARRALAPDETGLDQRTVHMIRTAPLWGLRVRPQMFHDGSAFTIDDAIRRHQGQAKDVTARYVKMATDHPDQAKQLIAFLKSL